MRFWLHVGLRGEKFESRVQVAFGAVFRDAAHNFVSHVGSGGDLAAIEIDRQGHVTLVGQLRGLFFHPVIEAPPFVNHNECGERPFARRRVEHALHGFVAAFVGDSLAVGGECGNCEEDGEDQQSGFFHSCSFRAGHSCNSRYNTPGFGLDDRARSL
jgi:hypothetical protein